MKYRINGKNRIHPSGKNRYRVNLSNARLSFTNVVYALSVGTKYLHFEIIGSKTTSLINPSNNAVVGLLY